MMRILISKSYKIGELPYTWNIVIFLFLFHFNNKVALCSFIVLSVEYLSSMLCNNSFPISVIIVI